MKSCVVDQGVRAMSGRFGPGDFGAGDQTEEIVTVLLLVRRDNGGDGYYG